MDTLVSLAIRFPLSGLVGDLHPLDNAHAEHTKVLPDINKKILMSGKRIEDVGGVCLIERRPFQKTSTFAFSHSEVTVFGLHFLVCMHSSVE